MSFRLMSSNSNILREAEYMVKLTNERVAPYCDNSLLT